MDACSRVTISFVRSGWSVGEWGYRVSEECSPNWFSEAGRVPEAEIIGACQAMQVAALRLLLSLLKLDLDI